MRRYIVTGAPGSGKTTIVDVLQRRGYAVVEDAASAIIDRERAQGRDEPWREAGFVDAVTRLQQERQQQPPLPGTFLQVYDRSPVCLFALARYFELPVTRTLRGEINRIVRHGIYQPRVFFVRLLGTPPPPSAALQISYPDAVRFEEFHREAYRTCGYELVDVPPGSIAERVDLVDEALQADEALLAEQAWNA